MAAVRSRNTDDDSLAQRLGAAFLISILAHTTFFAVLLLGQQFGWWESAAFASFRGTRLDPEEVARMRALQREAIFVQVLEPAEETPEDTPYYSSASSLAANPEPGNEDRPAIDGTQTRMIRLEDVPRSLAGQSSAAVEPSEPEPEQQEPDHSASAEDAVVDEPPRLEPVATMEEVELADIEPEPERPEPIGDLAMVRPRVEPRQVEENAPLPDREARPAAPVASEPQPDNRRPRPRPRTVVEARTRQAMLAGEKMHQEGGVARRGRHALNVRGTGFGAYDEALVLAVQNRWFSLLDDLRFAGGASGEVVVRFNLRSDGSVRIIGPAQSTVNDALLEQLCVRAVQDPAPYAEWPSDMQRMIGSNEREIRFTFYYN